MTVFVGKEEMPYRHMVMCHMLADAVEWLHTFGRKSDRHDDDRHPRHRTPSALRRPPTEPTIPGSTGRGGRAS
jgi:hypothetical protein